MVGSFRSTEGLTLKEVSAALGVDPRQVMYLRETGVMEPSVVGKGRGKPCLYTFEDAVLVYTALVELTDLNMEAKKKVIAKIPELNCSRLTCWLSANTLLNVEMSDVRRAVENMLRLKG